MRVMGVTLAATAIVALTALTSARADTALAAIDFHSGFLYGDGPRIDTTRFAYGNPVQAGIHHLTLYVNQQRLGRVSVRLAVADAHGPTIQACFDRALLQRLGVDLSRLSSTAAATLAHADATCHPLPALVEGGTAYYDMSDLRLDVTVPQVALARQARGHLDPSYWDDGVPAAILRYDASVYRARIADAASSPSSSVQAYVGLDMGLNAGPWRLRHVGNLSGNLGGSLASGLPYTTMQTYAQRAIVPLRARLTIGDGFTDGTLFDSVGYRGVQIASDDRMVPESQRGFAPTVRGIANTNARVQIRQGGNILYETTVAPGAFEIDDLYATGYGGDLDIVVTEADGSIRSWRVPFASTIRALRPGVTRFSLSAGQYRNPSLDSTPWVVQAIVQHGLSNFATVYGGVSAARDYAALAGGLALNSEYGALSFDLAQSFASIARGQALNGQRWRATYNQRLTQPGTNLSLTAYHQTGSGYLTLAEAVARRDASPHGIAAAALPHSRVQATVHQPLSRGFGTFYLSGSVQRYRYRSGTDAQFQIGYTNSFGRLSYSLSASRQFDVTLRRWDSRLMLTLGIPLGLGGHAPYSSTSLTYQPHGAMLAQQSLSGAAGRDDALGYGITASYQAAAGDQGMREALGASGNVTYVSSMATINGNASASASYRQVGGGITGVIVGYGGGLAASPVHGDTLAVVEADDAAGARLANASGARVGLWGRAVISNLQPFASNAIELDPYGLPLSVELKEALHHIAPTAGAVIPVRFDMERTGPPVLIRGRTAEDRPLPFGADVIDAAGRKLGVVAQGGRALVRGLTADTGTLTVAWGPGAREQCRLDYVVTDPAQSQAAHGRPANDPSAEPPTSSLPTGEGRCT